MKKTLIILVFIFLFITPLLSALTFEMKEEFGQEEVLMAKIIGDLTNPPLKENIFIYRGHVRTATDAYVAKINEDYYIYVLLSGKEPRNYSLVIEDIEYMKGSKKIAEDLVKNFTITEEFAPFTVNPGFVVTKEDFEITLENLLDEEIKVIMNLSTLSGDTGGISNYEEDEDYEIILKPGTDKIEFNLGYLEASTEKLITFSFENLTYNVPLSLYIDEQSIQNKIFAFEIKPEELEITIPTNENLTRVIYIYNTGTGTLTDIKLKLSESLAPYITISENSFGRIVPESNANLKLNIVSGGEKSLGGKLEVQTAEGLYNEMRISIKFEEGYEPAPEEVAPQITTEQNCGDPNIGGTICLKNEDCDGDEIYANNGLCCIGTCKVQPSGAAWKYIGWILLIALIVGGVWFYFKKYKGVKRPVDLLKIAQGKRPQ